MFPRLEESSAVCSSLGLLVGEKKDDTRFCTAARMRDCVWENELGGREKRVKTGKSNIPETETEFQ